MIVRSDFDRKRLSAKGWTRKLKLLTYYETSMNTSVYQSGSKLNASYK